MTELMTAHRGRDTPSVLPNEQDFIRSAEDSYAIYQLKSGQENRSFRFAGLSELREPVQRDRYDLIYVGSLPETGSENVMAILEDLYAEFNLFSPDDFHGYSLSVSDVIVLKQQDRFHAYYTDSLGFKPLDGFQPDLNPLRNAEIAMEDDFDMIDGIINNGSRKDMERLPDLRLNELHHAKTRHQSDPER